MAVSWRSWLANEGGKHLCLLLWLSWNVLLFWKTFLLYNQGPEYYYIHQMLGLGLCLSRASAAVLNLNCSFILLPMCRTLLAYLRGSQKVSSRRTRRLLDKSRTFHITCGVTICIFSGVHVAAHLVNALKFSVNFRQDMIELNAARYQDEDPRKLLFTTIPGLTGVSMVLVLFLMVTASTYAIRLSNYNIFWYTHNLFFVFYMLLVLHVSGPGCGFLGPCAYTVLRGYTGVSAATSQLPSSQSQVTPLMLWKSRWSKKTSKPDLASISFCTVPVCLHLRIIHLPSQ
ncbi:NADPH oxidase 4 isoform X3 [Erinaceus europaeus]|nr:NADPH oxidase 4 isoform X3 [Erinaceus europaeus]